MRGAALTVEIVNAVLSDIASDGRTNVHGTFSNFKWLTLNADRWWCINILALDFGLGGLVCKETVVFFR